MKVYKVTFQFPRYGSRDEFLGTSSSTQYFATRAAADKEARDAEESTQGDVSASVKEVDSSSVPAHEEIIGLPKAVPPKGRYIIRLRSVDGSTSKTYTTVAGARAFAEKYLGKHVPEIGFNQAVTDYGSVITIGGDLTWDLLYPELRRLRAQERHEQGGNPHVSRAARNMTLKARVNALVGRKRK
jgi:hypothetical protein